MRRRAVYLIGAGPGDPRLMTVAGLDCLRAADVVVYDHAVPQDLLKQAREGAELIDVGTAPPQSTEQEAIGYLLAEKVREGKMVARLKRGDPFVFDQGGEEALFLHAQGIPFEVIPGVPAGTAVPAYAGIPVTYPGAGDTVTILRGFEDDSRTPPDIDWTSLARLRGTVVCQTGAPQVPRILEALGAHGWPADGEVAVVYQGTLSDQETVSGTLAQLLTAIREKPRRGPATVVAGKVVGLRPHVRWFDARPLFGRRVLVTRPREQAAEFVDRLRTLGAEAIASPLIRVTPPDDWEPIRLAAAAADTYDWIVFTSANAVASFMKALFESAHDVRRLRHPRLCAVGKSTADRLAHYSLKADVVPDEFKAEAVVTAIKATGPTKGLRVLLPRADIGREIIGEQLREAGAFVTDVVAYHTRLEESPRAGDPDVYGLLLQGRIDVVTFASPSAVRSFAKIHGAEAAADLLKNTVVAVIGPVTGDAARALGIPVTIEATTHTIPALADAIVAHYAKAT